MTLNSTTDRTRVTANGTNVTFSFDFRILIDIEIIVILIDAEGVPTTKINGTDYTVSISTLIDGGTISLTEAPASGDIVVMIRDVKYTQEFNIPIAGGFPETVVENALDKNVMMSQQIVSELKRSARLPESVDLDTIEAKLPEPESGKFLIWGDNNGQIKNSTLGASNIEESAEQLEEKAQEAADSAAEALGYRDKAEEYKDSAEEAAVKVASEVANGLYGSIVEIDFSDSPYVPVVGQDGYIFKVDTSGGDVVVNLKTQTVYAKAMTLAFVKVTSDSNSITINTGTGDTINNLTAVSISDRFAVNVITVASSTTTWLGVVQGRTDNVIGSRLRDLEDLLAELPTSGGKSIVVNTAGTLLDFQYPEPQDNSITEAKLSTEAVTSDKIQDNAVTEGKLADASVTLSSLKLSVTTVECYDFGASNYISFFDDDGTFESSDVFDSSSVTTEGKIEVGLDGPGDVTVFISRYRPPTSYFSGFVKDDFLSAATGLTYINTVYSKGSFVAVGNVNPSKLYTAITIGNQISTGTVSGRAVTRYRVVSYTVLESLTSSGEDVWCSLLYNKTTGIIDNIHVSPEHVSYGYIYTPEKLPHPFINKGGDQDVAVLNLSEVDSIIKTYGGGYNNLGPVIRSNKLKIDLRSPRVFESLHEGSYTKGEKNIITTLPEGVRSFSLKSI